MRQDVFKVIEKARDITNAIVLTHNIDFIFVQSVIIPALRKCGSPTLTIFADAHCAEQTYQQQAPVLNSLGLRYRVVPVAMKTGFRFHPKAVLLSGTKQATLLVGSGNSTFGGWRENGEVWFRYDTEVDGSGPHAGFRNYLREIADLTTHSKEPALREVEEAFDPQTRTWAAELEPASNLLGRAGQGKSMLERMRDAVGDRKADRLFVCAPYFDVDAEALRTMAETFGISQTTVLVQSGRTNLPQSVADALGAQFILKLATFERKEEDDKQNVVIREALLHAKFYAFQCGSEIILFAGSANCSRAALTIPGSQGNAELMSSVVMSPEEFDRDFLSELAVDDREPQLAVEIEKPTSAEEGDFIHIHAARMTAGIIEVNFESSEGIVIQGASVDKTLLKPLEDGPGLVRFRTQQAKPLTILLYGQKNNNAYRSPLHWIDNEASLSESARSRSLGDSIRSIGQSREWGIGAWSEVFTELYKHLEYMPKNTTDSKVLHRRVGDKTQVNSKFTWQDVFSKDYGLPVHSAFSSLPIGMNQQVRSLKNLLLRWFGIEETAQAEDGVNTEEEPTPQISANFAEEEEPTDVLRPLPPKPPQPSPTPATANERKRALKLVEQVADRLASEAYLLERPPEMLSADLKVTAVLLRVALGNGWITEEEFFNTTLKIWMPLFFDAAQEGNVGWLELRHLTDSDPESFADAMRSAELSAALASWALALPTIPTTAAHARFNLAAALSVARLPWLWQTGGDQEIAKQVAAVLAYASGNLQPNLSQIESRWISLIRRGYALRQLTGVLADIKIPEISGLIAQHKVYAGEILWQGRFGFCVAGADCDRSENETCMVLMLQYGDARKIFRGSLLVPLAGLLENSVFNEQKLSSDARREAAEMVKELYAGMKTLPS
jgi:HKD family nuclease